MLHKHNADEINLIVSENSKLKYEIQLGDEIYNVSSPSTIFHTKRNQNTKRNSYLVKEFLFA